MAKFYFLHDCLGNSYTFNTLADALAQEKASFESTGHIKVKEVNCPTDNKGSWMRTYTLDDDSQIRASLNIKIAVNYEEWIKNLDNPEWSEWKDIQYIESTVGKSTQYEPEQWREHSLLFLNNYVMEKAVIQLNPKLHFIDETSHLYWIEGKGSNNPDFTYITNSGNVLTVEFKSKYTKEDFSKFKTYAWHNADIGLAYVRGEKALYEYDYTTNTFIKKLTDLSVVRYR